MKVRTLLTMLLATAGGLAAAGPASAQNPRTPGTCEFSRFSLDIGQNTFLVRNGDTVRYTIEVGNNSGDKACQVSNISAKLQFPGADGNLSPTLQPITNTATYVGQAPTQSFGPFF